MSRHLVAVILSVSDPGLAAFAVLWWLPAALMLWRRHSTPSLDSFPDAPPAIPAPLVSVILPARNEASHIGAFVQACRQSTWPHWELVIVDDHSSDNTAALAHEAASGDPRVRILSAPALPDAWFGKQWACQVGALEARGDLLLFTDADTRHAPDLITRLVAARQARDAALISVAGHQEMVTVWERAVQPSVFSLILLRYGGADALEHATRASDVIANGQCFLITRDMYDAVGRHEAVRAFVAEDVMMAQAVWARGGRVSLVMGTRQLSTRMYDSLAALMRGWGKNVYAGGRYAVRGGAIGRALYPVLLVLFPLSLLLPFVIGLGVIVRAIGMYDPGAPLLAWSLVAGSGVIALFAEANRLNGDPVRRALWAPLGAAVLLAICVGAVWRGRRVEWKGRAYQAR